ncbi:MAG: hypothetical protein ACXAC7_22970 [Candidatus Hodarchaeales archaeon]
MYKISFISSLLDDHLQVRSQALNLNVSENRLSPNALAALSTDIQSRYHANFYAGTAPAQEIISLVTELTKKRFKALNATIAPLSGNMCVLATILALTKSQDLIARLPLLPGGGYPFNYKGLDRKSLDIPFNEKFWQIDLEETYNIIKEKKPPLVFLGASMIIYPVPVKEIVEVVHEYGGRVAYDGSHVLGLIAGGKFQDPLREGADLLFGSTHKSFPGPQGGLMVTNNEEISQKLERVIGLDPLEGIVLLDNPHLARIASLGIVMEETPWQKYAKQVVLNSQAIAQSLQHNQIPLRGEKNLELPALTYSHQVLPDYTLKKAQELREYLAKQKILTDGFVRIGSSEITRLGFTIKECTELGNILASILKKEEGKFSDISKKINTLIADHQTIVL